MAHSISTKRDLAQLSEINVYFINVRVNIRIIYIKT